MFGLSEIAIILLVVIAVLCIKKLPELTRSAGKSARILKAESRAVRDQADPAAAQVIQGEAVTRTDSGTQGTQVHPGNAG
ncbi:twin-arginine translocase TatA/TatE family subunit [Streptomyces sp. M41]|uniref:twin-arginine translocase TatA/TatE family subunit n=1 Tax=Streptomyces sp. M41 TaxID=3059412 RepID=UPI00374D3366